jgi:hypothetical protein
MANTNTKVKDAAVCLFKKRILDIVANTTQTSYLITQDTVQGSQDTVFKITFKQDGKIVKIPQQMAVVVSVLYPQKNAGYRLDKTSPDYNITIEDDGTITVPLNEKMTAVDGQNTMTVEISDSCATVFGLNIKFNVIKNEMYGLKSVPNNLPTFENLKKKVDGKLNADYSNSNDKELKAKLAGLGIGADETPQAIKAKLESLKDDSRLDVKAVKGALTPNLSDVDLKKLDEKFQDTDSGKMLKQNSQAIGTKASKDLADVDTMDFETAFEKTPAHTTLVDTVRDLGNKAETSLKNVPVNDLSEQIKLTNAYKDLAGRAGGGLTPDEVRALFEANYFEEVGAVDLSQAPFTAPTLVLAYQFNTDNETITQVLPPVSQNKKIMIKVFPATGITNPTLILTPASGDHINGAAQPLTITNTGYVGYLLPVSNNSNWEFYPHETTHNFGLAVSDDKGNVHIGINSVQFKKATVTEKGGILEVEPDAQTGGGGSNITFTDFEGRTFTSDKIQSLDKSFRISNLGGIADISKGMSEHNEGIHACLGNDQLINSKFGRAKLYFGDIRVKGGQFVYTNMQDKSFVVQDVDPQDDPNKTQGDIKFLADGIVKMSYQAQCFNETDTLNDVEFWLAKVNGGGTFAEVAGSHTASTIEAKRTDTPKNIKSAKFTFEVKANETYRFFGKSNVSDGFYLQTSTVANPLLRFDYQFEELTAQKKS